MHHWNTTLNEKHLTALIQIHAEGGIVPASKISKIMPHKILQEMWTKRVLVRNRKGDWQINSKYAKLARERSEKLAATG